MKKIIIAGMLVIGSWSQAAFVSQPFSGGLVGYANAVGVPFTGTYTYAGAGEIVDGITVTLNVSGGYSGGFVMYLIGPDGHTKVTLLDVPDTATTGLGITMADGGTLITSSSDLSSGYIGTYAAAGSLSGFNGQSANGDWTLYFANLSSAGGEATLTGWSLSINAVPEPVNVALAGLGLVVLSVGAARVYHRRKNVSTAV
jgi:hypothetical protein